MGLFDLHDLPGYTGSFKYWLASPNAADRLGIECLYVHYSMGAIQKNNSHYFGIRPVIVLPPDVEFEYQNEQGIYEIVDAQ